MKINFQNMNKIIGIKKLISLWILFIFIVTNVGYGKQSISRPANRFLSPESVFMASAIRKPLETKELRDLISSVPNIENLFLLQRTLGQNLTELTLGRALEIWKESHQVADNDNRALGRIISELVRNVNVEANVERIAVDFSPQLTHLIGEHRVNSLVDNIIAQLTFKTNRQKQRFSRKLRQKLRKILKRLREEIKIIYVTKGDLQDLLIHFKKQAFERNGHFWIRSDIKGKDIFLCVLHELLHTKGFNEKGVELLSRALTNPKLAVSLGRNLVSINMLFKKQGEIQFMSEKDEAKSEGVKSLYKERLDQLVVVWNSKGKSLEGFKTIPHKQKVKDAIERVWGKLVRSSLDMKEGWNKVTEVLHTTRLIIATHPEAENFPRVFMANPLGMVEDLRDAFGLATCSGPDKTQYGVSELLMVPAYHHHLGIPWGGMVEPKDRLGRDFKDYRESIDDLELCGANINQLHGYMALLDPVYKLIETSPKQKENLYELITGAIRKKRPYQPLTAMEKKFLKGWSQVVIDMDDFRSLDKGSTEVSEKYDMDPEDPYSSRKYLLIKMLGKEALEQRRIFWRRKRTTAEAKQEAIKLVKEVIQKAGERDKLPSEQEIQHIRDNLARELSLSDFSEAVVEAKESIAEAVAQAEGSFLFSNEGYMRYVREKLPFRTRPPGFSLEVIAGRLELKDAVTVAGEIKQALISAPDSLMLVKHFHDLFPKFIKLHKKFENTAWHFESLFTDIQNLLDQEGIFNHPLAKQLFLYWGTLAAVRNFQIENPSCKHKITQKTAYLALLKPVFNLVYKAVSQKEGTVILGDLGSDIPEYLKEVVIDAGHFKRLFKEDRQRSTQSAKEYLLAKIFIAVPFLESQEIKEDKELLKKGSAPYLEEELFLRQALSSEVVKQWQAIKATSPLLGQEGYVKYTQLRLTLERLGRISNWSLEDLSQAQKNRGFRELVETLKEALKLDSDALEILKDYHDYTQLFERLSEQLKGKIKAAADPYEVMRQLLDGSHYFKNSYSRQLFLFWAVLNSLIKSQADEENALTPKDVYLALMDPLYNVAQVKVRKSKTGFGFLLFHIKGGFFKLENLLPGLRPSANQGVQELKQIKIDLKKFAELAAQDTDSKTHSAKEYLLEEVLGREELIKLGIITEHQKDNQVTSLQQGLENKEETLKMVKEIVGEQIFTLADGAEVLRQKMDIDEEIIKRTLSKIEVLLGEEISDIVWEVNNEFDYPFGDSITNGKIQINMLQLINFVYQACNLGMEAELIEKYFRVYVRCGIRHEMEHENGLHDEGAILLNDLEFLLAELKNASEIEAYCQLLKSCFKANSALIVLLEKTFLMVEKIEEAQADSVVKALSTALKMSEQVARAVQEHTIKTTRGTLEQPFAYFNVLALRSILVDLAGRRLERMLKDSAFIAAEEVEGMLKLLKQDFTQFQKKYKVHEIIAHSA